ncbi:MAG: outer membrane beta-barrel protein [Bacteroidota bacterium]
MKLLTFFLLVLSCMQVEAQSDTTKRYFMGIAVGTSVALGDFQDTSLDNPDAGFAQNGNRYDIYGGYMLSKHVTLTTGVRYQTFETDVQDVVALFNNLRPGITFNGENGDWRSYYVLVGMAYRIPIVRRFQIYPRFALGPLWVRSPGLEVNTDNGVLINNFSRSSETGLGLGYDIGLGLRTNIGKYFALLPTFTFSGGRIRVPNIATNLNNVTTIRDFDTMIQSFNLGLSLAFRL